MAKQLSLRLTRQKGVAAFDPGYAVNWHATYRRARQIFAAIAWRHLDVTRLGGLRNGFAIRAYAEDAALLESVRSLRQGKQFRNARECSGRRRIPPSVLMAATPKGRRLHAAETQLEERVTAREAVALCG